MNTLSIREPLVIRPDNSLLTVLDLFKKAKCHVAFISRNPLLCIQRMKNTNIYRDISNVEKEADDSSGDVIGRRA